MDKNLNEQVHSIRYLEDMLFKKWSEIRHPFATDGCVDSTVYLKAHRKIVFVLKERNWGHSHEHQSELQNLGRTEIVDVRVEFDAWWTDISKWLDVLLDDDNPRKSWIQTCQSYVPPKSETNNREWVSARIRESLARCSCMQLKKNPGGGTVNHGNFFEVIKQDRELILEQFSIYSPDFIISCGSNDNWYAFTQILFSNEKDNYKYTQNGVQYFIVRLNNSNRKTAIINFGHPSMRLNGTLWGPLLFGLRQAIDEIQLELN